MPPPRARIFGFTFACAALACTVDVSLEGKRCADTAPFCVAGYTCVAGTCVRGDGGSDGGTDAGSGPVEVSFVSQRFDNDATPQMTGLSWEAGDLVVVGLALRSDNHPALPVSDRCKVGDAGATFRNQLYNYDSTIAHSYVYFWTFEAPSPTTTGSVTIGPGDLLDALVAVWVVRGASTVLPATAPFDGDIGPWGFSTRMQGDPQAAAVQTLAVSLSADAGTRPAAGSLLLGVGGSFVDWSVLGAMGAPRTALPGFRLEAQNGVNDYTARVVAFRSDATPDGQSDLLAGTTSSDPLVYGNVIVLELR